MEFSSIKVFVKVVETGSFSAAAKALNMPKTTVSSKVAHLERRLGVTLIQRTTRKLHITDPGMTYFQHCAAALKEIESAEAEIQSEQKEPAGLLRVTAPPDLAHTVLPPIVSAYLKKYSKIQMELIVTNRLVDLVGEGVDIGIRPGPMKDSTLVGRKFFDLRSALYGSKFYLKKTGSPEHPRDLAEHQIILHSSIRRNGITLSDGKNKIQVSNKPRIISDDFETIKKLVLSGEGLAWLPSFLAEADDGTKELVQVLPKWQLSFASTFSFVYPGQKFSTPKVRSFIEFASEKVKENTL